VGGRNDGCFRHGSGRLVVGLATCGGETGWGSGWWLERWRERGREKTAKTGQKGCFFTTLNPIFSSIISSTEPLFIGGGRG